MTGLACVGMLLMPRFLGSRIPRPNALAHAARAFFMSRRREAVMAVTEQQDTRVFDDMHRLVALVRSQKRRDPLRALDDLLLDLRIEVARCA